MRATIGEFETLFADGIRTLVNWQRIRRHARVRVDTITDRDELCELLLPWWLDDGKWSCVGAGDEQLAIGDVQAHLHLAPAAVREKILELAAIDHRDPPVVAVPCYEGADGTLLLDGCHRTSAIALSGRPFRLLAFTLIGRGESGYDWDVIA